MTAECIDTFLAQMKNIRMCLYVGIAKTMHTLHLKRFKLEGLQTY